MEISYEALKESQVHGVRRSRRCQLLTSQAGFSFIFFVYVLQAERDEPIIKSPLKFGIWLNFF